MAERQTSTSSSSRPSQRSRASFRSSNPDIFSDVFALEPFEMPQRDGLPSPRGGDGSGPVAQNTRPFNAGLRLPPNRQSFGSAQHVRQSSGGLSSNGGRKSISSLSDAPSPISLHAAPMPSFSNNSIVASTPHRSISNTSTFTLPRTQSPYQGATGPSQPYGMYPQDIGVMRTPSTATTSTIRIPDRSYTGPSGPTQPYGMYPQNTVPEDEVSPVAGIAPIPVGFPGLGQDYRRRFGPDGEEADDLVGPDGHTEQLPPYTRYPNGIPSKEGRSTNGSTENTEGVQFDSSQNTLTAVQSRASVPRSPTMEDSSTHLAPGPAAAAAQTDESGCYKERFTKKSRKRVCCGAIPIWLIVLLLLVVAVLVGAVIGGVLGHAAGKEAVQNAASTAVPQAAAVSAEPSGPTVTITTTSLVDAVQITATPSNLPPKPQGSFAIRLGTPTSSNGACVTNAAQNKAWHCNSGADLAIELTTDGKVSLVANGIPNSPIRYGAQVPELDGPSSLLLMNNKVELNKGPAWFFQQNFTKVVVVKESDFSAVNARRWFNDGDNLQETAELGERDFSGIDPDSIAQPAAKPWYCYWNGTILEGFIYITENTTGTSSTSSQTSDSPPLSGPLAFASSLLPSMTKPPSMSSLATPGPWTKRQVPPSPSNLAYFPKVMKIEERRNVVNSVQPYCQQMQIMNSGFASPITDGTGKFIIVNISEKEPLQQNALANEESPTSRKTRRDWFVRRRGDVEGRDLLGGSCECQWECN